MSEAGKVMQQVEKGNTTDLSAVPSKKISESVVERRSNNALCEEALPSNAVRKFGHD